MFVRYSVFTVFRKLFWICIVGLMNRVLSRFSWRLFLGRSSFRSSCWKVLWSFFFVFFWRLRRRFCRICVFVLDRVFREIMVRVVEMFRGEKKMFWLGVVVVKVL